MEAEEDSEVYLLLYRKRGREPFYELLLDEKYRTGRIFSVFMKKLNVTNLEYNFKINGEIYLDPCASRISGREHFGAEWEEDPHKVRCVTLLARRYISSKRWEMKIMETPFSFN